MRSEPTWQSFYVSDVYVRCKCGGPTVISTTPIGGGTGLLCFDCGENETIETNDLNDAIRLSSKFNLVVTMCDSSEYEQ